MYILKNFPGFESEQEGRAQPLKILKNSPGTIADFERGEPLGLPEPNYLLAKIEILSKRLSLTKTGLVSDSLQTSPAPH